jgi:hypothetical protein
VLGLSAVNLSADLRKQINNGPTAAYWAQTGMIAALFVWLAFLYVQIPKAV